MHQVFMKVAVSLWDLSDAVEVRDLLRHCVELMIYVIDLPVLFDISDLSI